MGGKAKFYGKVGSKKEKTGTFPEKSEAIVQVLPWKNRSPPLHILDPNYPSFYQKCPRKCQETYNFDIFFNAFPNFGVDPKFDNIPPMCILLKLDYAKLGVSNLSFSNVIEEKPLGGGRL